MANQTQCKRCSVVILLQTAEQTGGLCMPCATGKREAVDEGKRRAAKRKQQRQNIEEGYSRISKIARPRLGDFLQEKEPVNVFWQFLMRTVFGGSFPARTLECLSQSARVLYLVLALDGEIENGGFRSYLSNSPSEQIYETLPALHTIGFDAVDLLEQAIATFPNRLIPSDQRLCWELLEQHEQENEPFWDALDAEYYSRLSHAQPESNRDLEYLILAFAQQHAEARVLA